MHFADAQTKQSSLSWSWTCLVVSIVQSPASHGGRVAKGQGSEGHVEVAPVLLTTGCTLPRHAVSPLLEPTSSR